MQIGIVGCRNHAARLMRILAGMPRVSGISAYHPSNPTFPDDLVDSGVRFEKTDKIEELFGMDVIIIASPNETHLKYIQTLLPYTGYLLCEKPPAASRADLAVLRHFPPADKMRIAFNFSYEHTALAKTVRKAQLGRFLGAEFVSMHGLAFKNTFRQSWRGKGENVFARIFGNVGIHYIHLVRSLFGPILPIIDLKERAIVEASTIDTATFTMQLLDGSCANVRLSYASPVLNSARVFYTDGYIELRNGKLTLHSPRDIFDASGRFSAPPTDTLAQFPSVQAYYDDALKSRIKAVLKTAQDGSPFPEDVFESALDAAEAVIAAKTPTDRPHYRLIYPQ